MQLIVNIDEKAYREVKDQSIPSGYNASDCFNAIWNGVPLPEGHGRLIDELDLDLFAPSLGTDEYITDLMANHNIDYVNGDDEDKVRAFAKGLIQGCMNVIKTAPTIVEAGSEG